MKIETGLLHHAVLQRNLRNVSDVEFGGSASTTGVVKVAARKGKRVIWRGECAATEGRFGGRLIGVPVGGPYEVELTVENAAGKIAERAKVRGIFVGDVWLAAGQSNMEGVGILKRALKPREGVQAMYQDDSWGAARDPLHDRHIAVDSVFDDGKRSEARPRRTVGVGPGVAFAQSMFERTGVPQGVIACALGATSMRAWDPAKLSVGGASLYGAMIRRLNVAGGRVAGMIWYQGESDALEKAQDVYTQKTSEFFAAVRHEAGDAAMPIVMAQIGRVVGWGSAPEWNAVQDQQRKIGESSPHVAVVATADLPLEDTIHLSSDGAHRLGVRMAYAMDALRRGKKAGLPAIKLKSAHIERSHPAFELVDVVLEFENVVGSFTSGIARPAGFCIGDPEPTQAILDIRLEKNRVRLITTFSFDQIGTRRLYYGHGTDPYVNITDEAGRGLLVMGALAISELARK